MKLRRLSFVIQLFCALLFASCSQIWSIPAEEEALAPDSQLSVAPPDIDEADAETDEKPEFSQEDYLRRAETAYGRGLYSVSREQFAKLREEYPGTPFDSFAHLKTADGFFFAKDFTAAIPLYEEFLKLHPGHEAAPYARLQVGYAHQEQYTGPAHDQSPVKQAQTHFERLIADYPDSYLVSQAKQGLTFCRQAIDAHEKYVAEFYRRAGKEQATNKRLSSVKNSEKTKSAEAPATSVRAQILESSVLATESSIPLKEETSANSTASPGPASADSTSISSQDDATSTASEKAPPEPRTTEARKKIAPAACRDTSEYSIAEISFAGDFELQLNRRRGNTLLTVLKFEDPEDAAVLSWGGEFSQCQTKRFSLRLGLTREDESGLGRNLEIRFVRGIEYRIFPLQRPSRLALVAFTK